MVHAKELFSAKILGIAGDLGKTASYSDPVEAAVAKRVLDSRNWVITCRDRNGR